MNEKQDICEPVWPEEKVDVTVRTARSSYSKRQRIRISSSARRDE